MKKFVIIGAILFSVPVFLHAQAEEKEKQEKQEKQEKKELREKKETQEMQTIVITRDVKDGEKTVVEIDGDKIKINGKDAGENKDVHVNVHKMKGPNTFKFNNSSMTLFSEDENRAMLGVVTETDDKGAAIQSITKESAAEKAGLRKGDIITKIGNEKIENADEVTTVIHTHKPGDKLSIQVLRDGKEQNFTAELGKWKGINMNHLYMPRMEELNQKMEELNGRMGEINEERAEGWNNTPMPPMPYNFSFGGRPKLGLSIQETDDGNGVKILDVEEESNAAKAGLEKDDIITKIDDKEVKTTEDVTRTIREKKDKSGYSFNILRDGKKMIKDVKIPRKLKTADL